MFLARVIKTDESSLICDLAETYHIYNYKQMPPLQVAIFCMGLRPDSRVMINLSGLKVSLDTFILADIRDKVALLYWSKTKDGQKNTNRPEAFTDKLRYEENEEELAAFDSSKVFEEERRKLLGGTNGN